MPALFTRPAVEGIQPAVAAGDVDHAVVKHRTRANAVGQCRLPEQLLGRGPAGRWRAATTIVRREEGDPVGGGGIVQSVADVSGHGHKAEASTRFCSMSDCLHVLAPDSEPHSAPIDLSQLPLPETQLRRGLDVSRLPVVRVLVRGALHVGARSRGWRGFGRPAAAHRARGASARRSRARRDRRPPDRCRSAASWLPRRTPGSRRTDRRDTRRAGRP